MMPPVYVINVDLADEHAAWEEAMKYAHEESQREALKQWEERFLERQRRNL